MRTITVKLFKFDELSESAKENAREWYRSGALEYAWWKSVYDEAETIGLKITSFDTGRSRRADGYFIDAAVACANKVIKEHGPHCVTVSSANGFLIERKGLLKTTEETEACETNFLKAILEDYSVILEKEMDYLLSDESVDDMIINNEYEFTEEGKRG